MPVRSFFFFLVFFASGAFAQVMPLSPSLPFPPVGDFPQGGVPQGGVPQGGASSIASASGRGTAGEHLVRQYGSCGTKTNQVMKSIKDFKSVVNNIKQDDKCRAVREALNKTVPNIRDIQGAIIADGMARTIKREKEKLRDINLEINRLQNAPAVSPSSPGGTFSPSKLTELKSERSRINLKLSQLEARFAVGEEAQKMKQYEYIVNTTDGFFMQVGNAFNRGCFENNPGVKEQALFSMTGMLGMIIGATPLGLGISAAGRLMKHFSDIDDTYQTTDSDEAILFVGIKCALRNVQKQHCETIKAVALHQQDQETQASAICTQNCHELQNQSFGSDIKKLLHTVQNPAEDSAPAPLSPQKFFKQFTNNNNYEGSAEQSLVNLTAFSDILKNENEFLSQVGGGGRAYCRSKPNSYKCANLDRSKATEAINEIISASKALNKKGLSGNDTLKAELMKEVKDLSTGEYLKNFTELVLAYSDYQSEKAKTHQASGGVAKAFRYINNRSVNDLINIKTAGSFYQEEDDQMTAEMASNAYMQDFSRIFTKKALKALSALEKNIKSGDADKKLKANMCMELIGLKPVDKVKSARRKIHEKCKEAEIQIGSVTLKYSDYVSRPFKEKVCAFQNALNCSNGEVAACSAHNRISALSAGKRAPAETQYTEDNYSYD